MSGSERELALFKKHFGEYKIIKSFKGDKMDKKQVLRVVKQLQIISVKPWQDTMKCSLKSSDGDWFSAFGKNVSKDVEGIAQGDVVEIEYTVNERGFNNYTSIKLTESEESKGTKEETPPDEEGVEKPPIQQRRGVERLDKNSISAGSIAVELMGLFDLSKVADEAIVEKFKILWDMIKEDIEK